MLRRVRDDASGGLSAVELMVIISIVASLAALLIPAVQAARESARRMSCLSNLRQFGIALNSYVTEVGLFPLSVSGRGGYSAHSVMLPHLDQSALYNAINFSVAAIGPPNQTVSNTSLAIFFCPSDGGEFKAGGINYAGSRGFGYQAYGDDGVFVNPRSSVVGFASITDGSSNTACMSERLLGAYAGNNKQPGQSLKGDPRRVVFVTSKMVDPSQLSAFISECEVLNYVQSETSTILIGSSWVEGGLINTMYNHMTAINANSCLNGYLIQEGSFAASSNHPGIASVLAADGHARAVAMSISPSVWHAVGTRAGGEILSLDSY